MQSRLVVKAVSEITVALREQTSASTEIAQNVERIARMAGENNAAAGGTDRCAPSPTAGIPGDFPATAGTPENSTNENPFPQMGNCRAFPPVVACPDAPQNGHLKRLRAGCRHLAWKLRAPPAGGLVTGCQHARSGQYE
jgi:hypothetical protein